MRYQSFLEVNLSSLVLNIENLKSRLSGQGIIFMVKANAYGHGMDVIARQAFEVGILDFGVASLSEAVTLRNDQALLNARVYVFSENCLEDQRYHQAYSDNRIIPVIHTIDQLEIVLKESLFKHVPLCIKIDTGMNRFGISYLEIEALIKLLKKYQRNSLDHLMTHLSSSNLRLKQNDRNYLQLSRWSEVKQKLSDSKIEIHACSIANSGAIEQGFGLDFTHVRPGLMLYGPYSTEEVNWSGVDISSLKSKVLSIRSIKAGDPIGYGASICPANGSIIYLPLGYGDGIFTFFANANFKHSEYGNLKILGRVNMDAVAIFTPNQLKLRPGDWFEFWGKSSVSLNQLAYSLNTITYQLTCGISSRVPRKYVLN